MKERENRGFEIDKSCTTMHPRVALGPLKRTVDSNRGDTARH